MWQVQDHRTKSTIDVVSDGNTTWVRQGKSSLINCTPVREVGIIPDDAQGIIGRDNDTVYQLYDRAALNGADRLLQVSVSYISDAEGKALLEQLQAGESPPSPSEDEAKESVITLAGVLKRLEELEEQNAMLTDCILEMSEAVYA